jgi:cupin superfamily acireductone dioxygenase involved in methionine salvage
MKTEIICIGTIETISRIWYDLLESGHLILMRLQTEGKKWIATFVILTELAEIIS